MDIFEIIKKRHSVRQYEDRKIEPEKISEIIESKKREKAGKTLPPNGLYLLKVIYE